MNKNIKCAIQLCNLIFKMQKNFRVVKTEFGGTVLEKRVLVKKKKLRIAIKDLNVNSEMDIFEEIKLH